MLKVFLPLLFAAFALTTALPVRNRFFEDVDDFKRDFLPKKTSNFYETAYDEYLRRREPALSEGLVEDYQDYPSAAKRVFGEFYYRDLPEKEEFSDDETLSRDFVPEEDERAFDTSDEDYPAPWNQMEDSFPEYSRSNDKEADEWLPREQNLWTDDDDEQEIGEKRKFDALEEKVDDESDLADDADMVEEAEIAEEKTNDAVEDESEEDFEEAYTTEDASGDVVVENAEHTAKESDAAAEEAVEEAKEAIVEDELEGIRKEEEAEEEDEGKQADETEDGDEPEVEDEDAKANQEEDEVDDMLQDEDETEEDDAEEEDAEEDEAKQEDETEEEDEVDDMLQDEDETQEDDAAEEDKEEDVAEQEDEPEEEDEADDMLEDDEIKDETAEEDEDEDEETEKNADELWKEDVDAENDEVAEARASLPRYRDFPSESKMVEDHNKLERELEYFKKHAFSSDDEAYEFDK